MVIDTLDDGYTEATDDVTEDGNISFIDILEAENLTEMLDDNDLTGIGQKVIRDVDIDKASRTEWLVKYERAMDTAMQVRAPKSFPWAGSANVRFPILSTAAVQFQARAYPAIVDGSNLVKGRVLGPDPDGVKRDRADRIGQHMTWQLIYKMPGWEEDTDKLLLMLPIVGCVFRKSYYDPIARANCSTMLSAKDFIVNYWAKSLESAPRYTHVLRLYPHEVHERIAAGLWRKITTEPMNDPKQQGDTDDDGLIEFYEQHRMLDLDDDGYPEPYVVTTTTTGEVARIVASFGIDDVTVRDLATGDPVALTKLIEGGASNRVGDIVKIDRRQYFTKYGFIPSPDGSFYDMGFGALLDDITATIDTTINQMLDAGALQNAQGGFVGSGVQLKGGDMRFRLGEWKRVDTTGGLLRDNIMPLQLNGPSAVLFNLLGMLIESAKDITSVQNVLTGEGTANQPATTTLALIEQGQKVMTAIFKRIHRAFGQELRILRRLNRDHLDEQEYFQLNDGTGDPGQVGQEDYADADLDVIPVSDPTAVSDMQKMARAQALMVFNGDPLVNQGEIRRRYMEAIGERDIKALLTVEGPATPDPKVMVEGAKLALDKEQVAADVRSKDAASANTLADAAGKLSALGLLHDAAELAHAATLIGGTTDDDVGTSGDAESVDGPGDAARMAGEPVDAGVPQDAVAPPVGPDGGMGEGGIPDAGGAGASGIAGAAGGPVA